MAVFIKEVSVQNLGPHIRLAFQLGRFNLIYGHNENGKTYLVEFIIRSLFKHVKQWSLRENEGRGKVSVAGLEPGGLVEFSPASENKLEDYWQEAQPGLPADFSRLLVVKGAEVDLAKVAGGIDKNVLKRLLSNRAVLDSIQRTISKTIQESAMENGILTGPRRGEMKERTELEERLRRFERLFAQLDDSYSGGTRKELEDEMKRLQAKKSQMELARRHLAFKTDADVRKLNGELSQRSMDKIIELRSDLSIYRNKRLEHSQKQSRQKEAARRSEHYDWLKSAQRVYQETLASVVAQPPRTPVVAAVALIVGAGILSYLRLPLYAVICLAGALAAGTFYFRRYRDLLQHAAENQELETIRKAFFDYFKTELTGLADIVHHLQGMEEDYNTAQLLDKQLQDDQVQLQAARLKLSEQIYQLTGEKTEPEAWDDVLRELEARARALEARVRDKELDLAQLNVDASDYLETDPWVEFSKQKLAEAEQELMRTRQRLDDETHKLDSLKHMICQQTGDDISASWDRIIPRLREMQQTTLAAYQSRTAEILGKIAVNEVVQELRKDEDSKILENLQSEIVQKPIYELTRRYDHLTLESERLVVSDRYNIFTLSELSTGAQEQILLALRIGLSKKLMREESLFLILDDAFQYSDWQRRQWLVDQAAKLAQDGWQIIYFTMDDNIRTLFEQKAAQFGEEYRLINLNRSRKALEQIDLLSRDLGY
ncbi:MAG: ATP-binding protein [bacterium]